MKAIIPAAGLGTRFLPVTKARHAPSDGCATLSNRARFKWHPYNV